MDNTEKMVVVCNHADAPHIMPAVIMAASGALVGNEVLMFFCPGSAQALVKGELEAIRDMKLKGLPDPVELYDYIQAEGGRVYMCELALENKGIDENDIRDGVEIVGVPDFLMEAQGTGLSLSF